MTRGTGYQADGFGRFQTGRLSRRPRRCAESGHRGDPGDLWGNHISACVRPAGGEGYLAIAPSIFDRTQRTSCGYPLTRSRPRSSSPTGLGRMRSIQGRHRFREDIDPSASRFLLGGASPMRRDKAAGLSSAVGYYGAPSSALRRQTALPTQLISAKGCGDSADRLETIKPTPEVDPPLSRRQHGFHCDERASYERPAPTSPAAQPAFSPSIW